MKNIIIILLLLPIAYVEAQTTMQQINHLRMEVTNLKKRVDSLEAASQLCCCQNKMFYGIADGLFWYENPEPQSLYLDDRFPTEGVCNGAKAILVTQDATLYLLYIPEGDGWVVWMATKGGLNVAD